jgi:uncharacterized protein
MSTEQNIQVMDEIFHAIERRDDQRVLDLCHPDVEFHWPPSLPYGGTYRGLNPDHPTWGQTWDRLQPTAAERKMDHRIVAASKDKNKGKNGKNNNNEDEVVVLWQQRGVTPSGHRFECPVLGYYKLRDAKLARAQMFYFDTTAVLNFLSAAEAEQKRPLKTASG